MGFILTQIKPDSSASHPDGFLDVDFFRANSAYADWERSQSRHLETRN